MVNFKKISEPNQGKKGKMSNPTKTGTKVQVDLLLHVISNEGDDKDAIPLPCSDEQVLNINFTKNGKKCSIYCL